MGENKSKHSVQQAKVDGKGRLISRQESSVTFSGPLPSPSILSGYEDILPGSADRIITMAEEQISHRQSLEQSVIRSNIHNEKTGMWLAFLLTLLLMLFGAYLILNDKNTVGYFAVFGPIIFHAGNYIYNKRKESQIK